MALNFIFLKTSHITWCDFLGSPPLPSSHNFEKKNMIKKPTVAYKLGRPQTCGWLLRLSPKYLWPMPAILASSLEKYILGSIALFSNGLSIILSLS